MGNYLTGFFWKLSPEREQAYRDGFEDGKKAALKELQEAVKKVKQLEACLTSTATSLTS